MTNCDDLTRSLPDDLKERTRILPNPESQPIGEYVVYWMRTAIRVEENPALDVALLFANQLNLPLIVYQGLSERYPFASDRHHTFILQGVRDVQRAFAEKRIPYLIHVERSGHRSPQLSILSKKAAAVVTEDMPTEPLMTWTTRLSQSATCSVFAVDTACVIPMRLVGKSYDRAFEFRQATKKLYDERISRGPSQYELDVKYPPPIAKNFKSLDLLNCDLGGLVRQCEIDHAVGPVPHTTGGFVAGYKRWNEFKQSRLSTYERRRNNPLVDGTSRLSPYLHYGMVAPTRIAREANALRSKGADKFLDELLIWRELAYAFCFYRRDHGTINALPAWARDSLREHEADSRDLMSWETMARGRTGDALWDSAQQSLLIHGELHNNIRMTWGKAVLTWTSNAKRALARMIDLNHRYALDGRDPASYGGILWCLGQADRPFQPPKPIFGTIRTRSTDQQGQRIDQKAYRRLVNRPLWNPTPKIAVIGAGISGLICARTLSDHGCNVRVFEKSRGLGGRMSTRRMSDTVSFDHGAQYFSARDPRFQKYVQSWQDDGHVSPWLGKVVTIVNGAIKADHARNDRYVAVPGMSALGHHLASDLRVQLQTTVQAPTQVKGRWTLTDAAGAELGQFDAVVVATPSNQAAELLVNAPRLAASANRAEMNSCWALLLAFKDSLGLRFDGAFVQQSPLAWIARNNSKPGRTDHKETWVAHANANWTESNLEQSRERVQQHLLDAFWTATKATPAEPILVDTQRWRLAIPRTIKKTLNSDPGGLDQQASDASIQDSAETSCLFDDERLIGACGDWCAGTDIEAAFLSGLAIAGRILGRFCTTRPYTDTSKKQQTLF